jgi:hypothetical protein
VPAPEFPEEVERQMALKSKLRSRFGATTNVHKWTFPIHLLLGLFLAAIPPASIYLAHILSLPTVPMFGLGIFLSLALLAFFAWDECWDDKCNGTHDGESDWWAAFASYTAGAAAFFIVCVVHGILIGVKFW